MQTKSEYEKICELSGEAFNEYVNEKNKLESVKQNDLVTAIILHCPDNEMDELNKRINKVTGLSDDLNLADETSSEDEITFLAKLNTAFALKKDLAALSYANTYTPHQIVLDLDLDGANEFNKLALSVLVGNELSVADNLVKKTPPSDRSKVAFKIDRLFPNSVLATKVRAAFESKREQEKTLNKSVMLSKENTVSESAINDVEPSVLANSNAFFTQSEMRNRHIDTVTRTQEKAVPKKFNLLHSDDEEERSCCEKLCSIF